MSLIVKSGPGYYDPFLAGGPHLANLLRHRLFVRTLDLRARTPHPYSVSRPDGRSGNGRKAAGEESPGSMDIRCRITSGGGNPRESATENRPPRA